MITFTAGLFKFFIATTLLIGTLVSLCGLPGKKQFAKHLSWSAAAGIVTGLFIYIVAFDQGVDVEAKVVISGLMLIAGLLTFVNGWREKFDHPFTFLYVSGPLVYIFFLSVLGVFGFVPFALYQALSLTTVLNTELILNIAAICLGTAILVLSAFFSAHALNFIGKKASLPLFAVLVFFPILNGSAEVILGMMQMQLMEVTSLGLSFVAKVIGFQHLVLYFEIFIFSVAGFMFYLKRPVMDADALNALTSSERRKKTGYILQEYRWIKGVFAGILLVLGPLLYYDLYDSQPPKITKPTPVTQGEDGFIRFKVEDVKDGNLHRYSYVTSDGTKVRFFLINRYPDRVKIGVVFDSCLVCGDMGYNQEGNDVICLACNVRMFIPSIGKPGGCNPIPMKSRIVGDEIEIAVEDLENGAEYFSELVEIEVKDPVSKGTLVNLKAPFRYDYKGHTFFFETQDNYNKFVADPEQYTPNLKKRPTRVDGYPSEEGI